MDTESAVIQQIVDYLQPLLEPYEVAFYWYAFRHSFAKQGKPHVRLGKSLRHGVVVRSLYSTPARNTISEEKFRKIIKSLESIGALRREGSANREGTLYRVMVPAEIEACLNIAARSTVGVKHEILATDIDFYNVRENRRKVYDRDQYKCRYCNKQLTYLTATLDHVTSVANGGDNGLQNLVTACLECNSRKHNRPVGDFMADSNQGHPPEASA